MHRMQIAIDGPAGAGKSSVAKEVARRLGLHYLDTGAMYRAITYKALQEGIDLTDGAKLAQAACSCNLGFEQDEETAAGTRIFLDNEDITAAIRSSEINKHVSIVSKSPELRSELVALQRKIAKNSDGIVMEGRDIGTNVLVQADFKFFISASVEERARRRWQEMKKKGIDYPFDDIKAEIIMRDEIDQGREVSPLTIAPGAEIIDTTTYTEDEVVEKLLSYINTTVKEVG